MDQFLDDVSSYDDDDWLYDPADELAFDQEDDSTPIDLSKYREMARRKTAFHYACTLDNYLRDETLSNLFLSEAEMFLNNSDYESALVSLYAAASVPTTIRLAIETICLYQLGDREAAIGTSSQVKDPNQIDSLFLRTRFLNTVEVLEFMPQLLGMLSQMKQNS